MKVVVYPIVGGFISKIFTLQKVRQYVNDHITSSDILCIVVTEGNTPEDQIEKEEEDEVDDSPEVVNLVSLHPVRVPAGVVTERINVVALVVLVAIASLPSVLGESQSRVDCFGLGAEYKSEPSLVLPTLPFILGISLDVRIHVGMDYHHHNNDVERVQQPNIDHFYV